MRWLTAVAGALLLAALGTAADAYVVEVTTTLSVADARDETQMREAVHAAVEGALGGTITFAPTLVVLTRAVVVGDRVHVRLLVADEEGERAVRRLTDGVRNEEELPPDPRI